ncbi:MAG: hypothetical protein CVV27_04055 [Candidatus Melainabacteria bacterium HGW-Melainabacteria-1]|nr:MAG: hypothetical protein CVV27_04055 [Candidatus Melainabacteria bacterium HGW-Melainabacteria-1]
MFPFNQDALRELIDHRGHPAVSIYIPTRQVAMLTDAQDRIRFKNAIDQAGLRLQEYGIAAGNLNRILGPAKALLEDTMFWQHQSQGLAVFMAPDLFRAYRMPIDFDEHVIVNGHFHIPPLMSFFEGLRPFFILSLSQNHVTLFKANKLEIEALALPGLPADLKEVLQYDDFEKDGLYQSSAGFGGAMGAHQGEDPYSKKEQLATFAHLIDKALTESLAATKAPLVLACVDYLAAIYRQVSNYPLIVEQTLTGNQLHTHPQDLHSQAWSLVEPLLAKEHAVAVEHFAALSDTDRILCKTDEIAKAAYSSRIETLFLISDTGPRGEISYEGEVSVHLDARPEDEDLVNLATIYTLQNGGQVYKVAEDELREIFPMSLRGAGEVAAILRY